MEWFRNYLIRKQDTASVSYSRFGRPGEDDGENERPIPREILIADFDENQFKVLRYWHIEKATASLAAFSTCMVILFFISSFFEFNWYHHTRGVDISALLGLFTYLAIGVLIHYYVLYGIKKQTAYYLLPLIVVYSVVLTGEAIALIGLIIKVVEPEEPGMTGVPYSGIFFTLLIIMIVQAFVLSTVLRCRQYLSLKETHLLELRVAEKGRAENPTMQIVVVGQQNVPVPPIPLEAPVPPADPVLSADNPIYGHNTQ